MDHVASLIVWLVAYSVSGGFFHFVGCWLILAVIVRISSFVRVDVKTTKPSDKTKSSEAEA